MLELFADYVEGNPERIAVSLSTRPLGKEAVNALDKSLAAFGYGSDACSFVTSTPRNPEVEGGDIALDSRALFLLMEALDPLIVICADDGSTQLFGKAYRMDLATDVAVRVFGRPVVAFRDLNALMQTDDGRQKAWKLLKSLPRR